MDIKKIVALFIALTFASGGVCLRIGAFNIRVFGVTKMKNDMVVDKLVETIARYDVLLIQEIRDSSGEAIQDLLTKVNMRFPANPFNMTLSPRLGRTNSKEQYAFLYRELSGLKVAETYVYDDGDESLNTDTVKVDTFEREPYVVLFHSTKTTVDKFALIGIHVAPSDAVKEIEALKTVFAHTKSRFNVANIMVLGDLNADCSYVAKKDWADITIKDNPAYTWWIGDDIDTTVGNTDCAYDRFISTGEQLKTAVVNGSVGIFKYDEAFQLDQTMALQVSDHYPIEMTLKRKNVSSGGCTCMEGCGHVCVSLFTLISLVFVCTKYLESP